MRRPVTSLVAVLAVLAPAAIFAQASRAADEKQILANEHAVHQAFAKGDATTFLAHLAPDAFAVDPAMGVMKAADFVSFFKDIKLESWTIDQSRVDFASNDVAVHTFRWTGKGTFMGQPFPSPVLSSTVWVKKGGKWLAYFHQETLAVTPPGK